MKFQNITIANEFSQFCFDFLVLRSLEEALGEVEKQHEHDRVNQNAEVTRLAGGIGGLEAQGAEHAVGQLVHGGTRDHDEEKRDNESFRPGKRGHWEFEIVVLFA
jgi:hypothetical protein